MGEKVSSTPGFERFKRKLKAEPLVPIGCLATATILGMGLLQLKRGNVKASQKLMRGRVAAQTATVLAMAYGAYSAAKGREEFDDSEYKGNLGSDTQKEEEGSVPSKE